MTLVPPTAKYDEDHEAFRDSVRRFLASSVVPRLDDFRATGGFPRELISELGEQGLLGTSIPETDGGGGADRRFDAVLLQEIVRVGAVGLAQTLAGHLGAGAVAVVALADGPRRAELIGRMLTGESLVVPLVVDAAGQAFGVPGAVEADAFVVVADDGVAVIGREDFEVVAVVGALGGRDASAGDVTLDLATLTLDGDATEILSAIDLSAAVLAVAGAWSAVDLTVEYVNARKVFGQPVASFENTRYRLAEVASQISVAEVFTEHCLDAADAGTLTREQAGVARLVSGDAHDRAVDQGMQLHGGYGYMREYPISTAFSDARFLRLTAAATSDPRPLLAVAVGL